MSPEQVLLLAEADSHTLRRTFRHNEQIRVSDLSTGPRTTFLAYVYPSSESGPLSSGIEVQIFHRYDLLDSWAGSCLMIT